MPELTVRLSGEPTRITIEESFFVGCIDIVVGEDTWCFLKGTPLQEIIEALEESLSRKEKEDEEETFRRRLKQLHIKFRSIIRASDGIGYEPDLEEVSLTKREMKDLAEFLDLFLYD